MGQDEKEPAITVTIDTFLDALQKDLRKFNLHSPEEPGDRMTMDGWMSAFISYISGDED